MSSSGVAAMRAGRMNGTTAEGLARASRTRPKGLPSSRTKLFLSVACKRSVAAIKNCPSGSRWLQRRREATQSSAVTGWPSWNLRPSRSETPLPPVGARGPRVDHLRPDLALLVLREERVVDEVGVRPVRDVPRVACHVEDAQVRMRYEAQGAASLLGVHERRGEREGGGSGGAADEELTPTRLVHDVVLPGWSARYPTELTNRSSAGPTGIRRVTLPAHASGR